MVPQGGHCRRWKEAAVCKYSQILVATPNAVVRRKQLGDNRVNQFRRQTKTNSTPASFWLARGDRITTTPCEKLTWAVSACTSFSGSVCCACRALVYDHRSNRFHLHQSMWSLPPNCSPPVRVRTATVPPEGAFRNFAQPPPQPTSCAAEIPLPKSCFGLWVV